MFRSALRPVVRSGVASARFFHATPGARIRAGQPLPDIAALVENGSPGDKINLAEEIRAAGGMGLIVGVPAAFSGPCSSTHIPSYVKHPKLKSAAPVFVVAVNDAFVVKAWKEQLDPANETGIRFLGDPAGEFTKAIDLVFPETELFGNHRSKRYALVIEDSKVKAVHVEPDGLGTSETMADKVLG